mmetsp:Transcript_86080/g.180018  ORF Transcript_86080/g.180018 Transcript_86080/m.180018 type:complete len:249 (+) Transcript_86080:574-1320(+)
MRLQHQLLHGRHARGLQGQGQRLLLRRPVFRRSRLLCRVGHERRQLQGAANHQSRVHPQLRRHRPQRLAVPQVGRPRGEDLHRHVRRQQRIHHRQQQAFQLRPEVRVGGWSIEGHHYHGAGRQARGAAHGPQRRVGRHVQDRFPREGHGPRDWLLDCRRHELAGRPGVRKRARDVLEVPSLHLELEDHDQLGSRPRTLARPLALGLWKVLLEAVRRELPGDGRLVRSVREQLRAVRWRHLVQLSRTSC